jgi:hypothetical protein
VFIITRETSGIGYELAKSLYYFNGKIYVASRSASSAQKAAKSILTSKLSPSQITTSCSRSIHVLQLNLSGLNTIKATRDELLSKEEKYTQSKAINCMQAHEFTCSYGSSHSAMAMSLRPGALHTGLQKNTPGWYSAILVLLQKEPRFSGLTNLYARLVTIIITEGKMVGEAEEKSGGYVLP